MDMSKSSNLRNERGWQMSTHELKRLLGYKEWPDEGVAATIIGQTVFYVLPRNPKGKKTHRTRAICVHCGKHVPAGRLHQHQTIHKQEIRP